MSEDIVVRLEKWAALRAGDPIPDWGTPFQVLLDDALAEIKRLRALAGAVTPGESFSEIRDATKKPSA